MSNDTITIILIFTIYVIPGMITILSDHPTGVLMCCINLVFGYIAAGGWTLLMLDHELAQTNMPYFFAGWMMCLGLAAMIFVWGSYRKELLLN